MKTIVYGFVQFKIYLFRFLNLICGGNFFFFFNYLCFLSSGIDTGVRLKAYSEILRLFPELSNGTMKYDGHTYTIKCIKYV